jgi:site-specific DNA recombinase
MRAAIYARISQDTDGTALGVTRQQEDCLREAERRGWEVVQRYVDNDVSATRSKVRPEYQRMLADVASGHIGALVVWDIDRLTRTPRELEDVIDLADRYGLALANVGGEVDLSTSDGRMMARIKGTLARREVEQMSKRLKRKFEQKALAGEPHGFSPYGYRRVPITDAAGNVMPGAKRDEIDPEQAAVIREAVKRVLASESLRSIVADFNAREIHGPRAPQWNSTILRQILLRPTNAGMRQHQGKVRGKSTGDAIISENTLNEVTALLTDPSRKSNHVGPGYKYLLSGIARCGLCGGIMRRQIGRTTTSKTTGATKRQPPSYNCSECFKVRRAQLPVDDMVSELVIRRLSQPDAVDLFTVGDSSQAKESQESLNAIDAKLDIAADQFADDTITGAQLKRITARLRADRERAEAQFRSAQPRTALTTLVGGDVRAKWEAMPIDAQREAVQSLMTVTIKPSGSGRRFDPKDVAIERLT